MSNNNVQFEQPLAALGIRVLFALLVFMMSAAYSSTVAGDDFMRPWESRPYKVQVWICSNNSPEITAVLPLVATEITRRAEIADPSAWNVSVEQAPNHWRTRLLESIAEPVPSSELGMSPEVEKLDKIVAVCLKPTGGSIRYRVRELDIQTGQWGPIVDRICPQSRDLPFELYSAIARVFMPLTRIDRVNEQGEVFVRARAMNSCLQCDLDDGTVSAIENSPVWVRPADRFLPIIRKVDKNGDLTELSAIPFTYLTVDSQDGSRLVCQIHSRQRASLGGRSSKRAQKLALVIRPPDSPTSLKLLSRGDQPRPLAGYEIFSRKPNAEQEEESEFIGLTDWRGIVEVPPADEGLRLIYVKHGSRALMKLPIIPGLFEELSTAVPDDEARLNAEGVMRGFQTEILNLVAQRELTRSQALDAVEDKKLELAEEFLAEFQRLESPQDLKIRLANAETKLKNETQSPSEFSRIAGMFERLTNLVNDKIKSGFEEQIQAAIIGAQ